VSTIAYRFLVRGGTASAVSALNEVVHAREIELETDTGRFKFGNGTTAYSSLLYANVGLNDLTGLADGMAMVYDATLGHWKVGGPFATQAYVDAALAGLSWKQAVRVATTAAGTLASSFENGDTVDGVTLATGDRILIKNQATASENGIYLVNVSGAPTRASDANAAAELVNASVYVSEGTTNADTQWTCTTNAPITLGTTSLAWAQLTSGGSITDGDKGDVVVSGSGTAWTIDSLAITTAKLADNAVTYAKMQDVSATSRILGRKTASAGDAEECTLSEVLDFIGSAAQGDILYRGASGWARLGAGTSGQVLKTGGASANPSWGAVPSGSGGAMTYVGTATVTGSAATSFALSGLDLSTDQSYYIVFALKNASTTSTTNVSLFYNSDTTATNYFTNYVASNAPASRANSAVALAMGSSGVTVQCTTGFIAITLDIEGKARAVVQANRNSASGIDMVISAHA
jgi:hypothetical protein